MDRSRYLAYLYVLAYTAFMIEGHVGRRNEHGATLLAQDRLLFIAVLAFERWEACQSEEIES